jgi:hypothetical protein
MPRRLVGVTTMRGRSPTTEYRTRSPVGNCTTRAAGPLAVGPDRLDGLDGLGGPDGLGGVLGSVLGRVLGSVLGRVLGRAPPAGPAATKPAVNATTVPDIATAPMRIPRMCSSCRVM